MRRPQQIVAAFALGCLCERVDDEGGQHHRAVAVRLQRADDDRAVHHDGVTVQLDTAPQKIHVAHSQCGGFTPPKATDAEQQDKPLALRIDLTHESAAALGFDARLDRGRRRITSCLAL